MTKKTVFITGANGFVGKNVSEQLKNKYHLLTPLRKELDLLDEKQVDKYFKKNSIDVVVHCAVVGGSIKEQEVSSALSDNLKIFLNLIKNKKRFNRMIQLGSGAEYDKNRSLIKVKETDFGKSIPQDDYSLYKYTASKIIENWNNVICLRIFGLLGKYDYHLRFISNSICRNLLGLPIFINQNRYFDYMYIDDFVKIIDYFISHKTSSHSCHVGHGEHVRTVQLFAIPQTIAGKKSKVVVKKSGRGNEYTCSNLRLKKEMPNVRFTDISEAIRKLYNWYKEHQKEVVL